MALESEYEFNRHPCHYPCIYPGGQSVKDWSESLLAESLDLSCSSLAEVEVLGELQSNLTSSSLVSDLEVRLAGEEENG